VKWSEFHLLIRQNDSSEPAVQGSARLCRKNTNGSVVADDHSQVTFVPRRRDQIVFQGHPHSTSIFVQMQTVGKLAPGNEGTKFHEEAFHFNGLDIPQFQLTNPRRIDNPTTRIQFQKL
jgi:hypothetical protein